ncbi:MAG: hypothetical protein O2951_05845 [Bacteroidetes bacterium]|nr:hypothetical protein [Bacteroidota bacterium]
MPKIDNFNASNWREDKFGCRGNRQDQLAALQENKDVLLGLNQNEMSEILGSPDEHELYERNQKFFYYYITPGSGCDQAKPNPIRLQIRFSAMGIANEVFFENL